MWVDNRALELTQSLGRFLHHRVIRWTFLPSDENDFISYFSSALNEELKATDRFGFSCYEKNIENADVVVFSAHGSNKSKSFYSYKKKYPHKILVAWLWDNHLGAMNNYCTVQAADIYVPTHIYMSSYLSNPCSAILTYAPACVGQWTAVEAQGYFEKYKSTTRQSKALVNYVNYTTSWRHALLNDFATNVGNAEVRLMQRDDRSRYFNQTKEQQFAEWMDFKSTLILPLENDLSTRFFDALLTGMVPIVPTRVLDFDKIIPPADQKRLGIVRVDDLSYPAIVQAIDQANGVFDQSGPQGCVDRHQYVLQNHMLPNRLLNIVSAIKNLGQSGLSVQFLHENVAVPGLFLAKQP